MALSTTTNYSLRKHDAGDLNWDVDMNWNMTEIDKKLKLLFANFLTCSTAAGTTAKTVAFANFVLEAGCLIAVKFTNGNSASAPTLNVNSTGAKAIQYNGAAIPTNAIVANGVYLLAYDGTNWALLNPVTVSDAITEDETGLAPSQGTVFDALAFKLDSSDVAVTAAANKIPKADALGKIDPDYLPDARITFATTSTDNATSATNAPLKTAGGLAVAKQVFIGTTDMTSQYGGINMGLLRIKSEAFTLEAGASKEISCYGGIVCIFIPSVGLGGLFFLDYANASATKLAGIGEVTDTGSTFAILGSINSITWQLKNTKATSTVYRVFSVNI